MANLLVDRTDILEALVWLKGQRVSIGEGPKAIETTITSVIETMIPLKDGITQISGIKITTDSQGDISIKFPHIVEETEEGFVLDFDTPHDYRPPELRKEEIEREDARFFDFLRSGRGHKFKGGEKSKRKIIIKVLD